jgi:hypothetical protein
MEDVRVRGGPCADAPLRRQQNAIGRLLGVLKDIVYTNFIRIPNRQLLSIFPADR